MPSYQWAPQAHQLQTHATNHAAANAQVSPGRRTLGATECAVDAALNAIEAVRAETDWLGTAARLVTTPDRRAIRSVLTGRRVMVTGSYASKKARRGLPYEGMNELALLQLSEVDIQVVDFRSQPFRFEFTLGGVQRAYIADCVRVLADGRVEVVEVKSDSRALKDADYADKLRVVERLCAALGWSFRVAFKRHLFEPATRRENILWVQSQRMTRFGTADVYVALEALVVSGGEAPLRAVAERLGDHRVGTAMLMAMMVARIVELDLDAPISDQTRVSQVREVQSRQIEGAL